MLMWCERLWNQDKVKVAGLTCARSTIGVQGIAIITRANIAAICVIAVMLLLTQVKGWVSTLIDI